MSEAITGRCPFCIDEYPDGQEFCRAEKTTTDGGRVFAWELSFSCSNCGTIFMVVDEEINRDEELDLRERLCISEQSIAAAHAAR